MCALASVPSHSMALPAFPQARLHVLFLVFPHALLNTQLSESCGPTLHSARSSVPFVHGTYIARLLPVPSQVVRECFQVSNYPLSLSILSPSAAHVVLVFWVQVWFACSSGTLCTTDRTNSTCEREGQLQRPPPGWAGAAMCSCDLEACRHEELNPSFSSECLSVICSATGAKNDARLKYWFTKGACFLKREICMCVCVVWMSL